MKDVRPYKGKWQIEKGYILNKFPTYLTDLSECKLVIATNNPTLDIPKVVDEVEKLAKDYAIKEVGNWYNEIGLSGDKWGDETHLDFKNGYNHSQSTHPNSDEDVKDYLNFVEDNYHYHSDTWHNRDTDEPITRDKLLQLWKDQRPQTIYFN